MAGIYIHIPFCRKACTYCDFHFSTSLEVKDQMIGAIKKEIALQRRYSNEPVETIYFGGGTPSVLSAGEIDSIITEICNNYPVDLKECTLESNPDDLGMSYLAELVKTKVNRLSIGIQSFNDDVLKWMNRSHDSKAAISSVKNAFKSGFEKISVDLIYAVPGTTLTDLEKDLEKALDLPVNHLSAYCLTAEEKTVYGKLVEKRKISEMEQENAREQFLFLVQRASEKGFEQYEISNFCKNENYAVHNTGYWQNKSYIGIGPSAHSYNGRTRQWNVKNNFSYIKALKEGLPFYETEVLTHSNKINEYLMTSLRTKWGADLSYVKNFLSGEEYSLFENSLQDSVKKGFILMENGVVTIPLKHRFIADRIIAELFL